MFIPIVGSPLGRGFRGLCKRSAAGPRFFLTSEDRLGIERLLHDDAAQYAPNPDLVTGLLRHKLRTSRAAAAPASCDRVMSGCCLTYLISGDRTRSGVLSMTPTPRPGRILVPSLLGATLIGMQAQQEAPLLRDDGDITSLVVLEVISPSDRKTD